MVMVCSVWPLAGSILSRLPGLPWSLTHSLPAPSTATSPRLVPDTFKRMVFSARAVLVPPAVLTVTLPSPCTGSAVRFKYALPFWLLVTGA